MSTQPSKPSKPDTEHEKKTDKTTVLSPEELRAISGGTSSTPPGNVKPATSTQPPGH
jgi:hypothetical protein